MTHTTRTTKMESFPVVVPLSKLYAYLHHDDSYDMWLDAQTAYMPVKTQLLQQQKQHPRPETLFQNTDAIFDAHHSIDKTREAILRGVPIIRQPSLVNAGMVSTPPFLVSKERIHPLLQLDDPSYSEVAPYVALKCVSTSSVRDPFWNFTSAHVADAVYALLQPSLAVRPIAISGVRYTTVLPTKPFLLHRVRGHERAIMHAALQWFLRVYYESRRSPSSPPILSSGSCVEMCPLVRSSSTRSAERAAHIRDELERLADITLIYRCGVTLRRQAWKLGARTYHDALALHAAGKLRLPPAAVEIIAANPRKSPTSHPILTPTVFDVEHTRFFNKEVKECVWIATDFETIHDVHSGFWIFMIATLVHIPEEATPRTSVFCMESLTIEAQVRMLCAWSEWMLQTTSSAPNVPVFHWAPAERFFLRHALHKCHNKLPLNTERMLHRLNWIDMCQIFICERVALTGCFDYKLKHIAKALHAHGKITHVWEEESEVSNGLQAMRFAQQYYETPTAPASIAMMKTIQKYNEMDTRVLYEIVQFVCTEMLGTR